MNTTTLLSLVLFFQFTLCFAQTDDLQTPASQSQSKEELLKEEMDSLVRGLRKSFYGNDYAKTIEDGNIIIKQAERLKDYTAVANIASILSNAFLEINDTSAAKKIINKQLKQSELRKDTFGYLGASIDLGNFYIKQGDNDKAIESYKNVIPYAKKAKDTVRLFILNYNISELYLDKEDESKAQSYVYETGKYVESLPSKVYPAGYQLILGRLLYMQGDFREATVHLRQAIELSEPINYTDALIKSYSYYALANAKMGNYIEAYKMQQQVALYKEEKYNQDKIKAVETVTAKFNLEQYKQELEATELRNQLIEQEADKNETILTWVSIGSIGLLLFITALLVSYNRRKKLLKDLKEKNVKYLLAKEKSEELANAKSLFFSNISHELRTPLYGIIGLSSILMDDKDLHKHKDDVKSLKFSADYLLSLINDVLQISKLDSKQETNLNKITFNLNDLVTGIMKSFEFLKVQNMNDFKINIDKNAPSILVGDDVKLSQILINVIGNACKFTENGVISLDVNAIAIKDEKATLNFKIKDTGIGIAESKQQLIFDEFTQVKNEGGHYQGTGLGLPIVKKLLELHNSEINLISEEGKGTEISFTITYDIAEENYSEVVDIELEPKISINNKSILVVDDNRINRIVTRKMLEKYKAKPLVAEGGLKAVEIVKNNKIDLILMDINMPEVNGLEATEAIREFNSTVPVIALTAVEIEEMRESIQNSTICDIIIKPYDELVFVETILKHL
ncbi:ATP-binding response regulator [Lacinutrix chionoecetis]